jgi:hypothetical protein
MKDLFTLDRQFEPIPMPDADVSMLHEIQMPLPYDRRLRRRLNSPPSSHQFRANSANTILIRHTPLITI